MPPILRSRLALIALFGVFLIPIGLSSLRGLTHVLTCQADTETPFTVKISDQGVATLLSSVTVERGREAGLCGGLAVNPSAESEGPGRVKMSLPIRNGTAFRWQGTVKLLFGNTTIPVNIGAIDAGATATDEVRLRVDPGTHELNGSLLIGP